MKTSWRPFYKESPSYSTVIIWAAEFRGGGGEHLELNYQAKLVVTSSQLLSFYFNNC